MLERKGCISSNDKKRSMGTLSMDESMEAFTTTAFPDLTGRSLLGKDTSNARGVAKRSLGVTFNELHNASAKLGISVNALFLAAWAKLLAAYAGEDDVCIGWMSPKTPPATNSEVSISESQIIPLQARLGKQVTNSKLLRQLDQYLRSHAAGALVQPHETDFEQRASFDTCVAFGPGSQNSENSFNAASFQYLAVFLHIDNPGAERECLRTSIHFKRSLLLDDDAQIVLSTFETALLSVTPSLDSLSLDWANLDNTSTSISNQGYHGVKPDHGATILDSVAYHSKHQPDKPALDFLHPGGQRTVWTFAELYAFGARIAASLVTDFGVSPEVSIPICIPKSPSFYAAILGVMMAGACFTPFSDAPLDRKRFMLEELGAELVLYAEDEDMSWCQSAKLLNITPLLSKVEGQGPSCYPSKSPVQPQNLVYQMYTSGSTGRPKAVSLEHRHIIQTVAASKSAVPWGPESRMLQYASPSFDMCYYDTFLSWYLGICLCSASSDSVYNDLPGTINALEVSMLGLTPSVAATLDPVKVPGVQWLYCIGEAMPQTLVDMWSDKLFNSYGPTEAAQMVTLFPVRKEVKSSVIGVPFSNTSFQVIRQGTSTPVPVLGIGELHIGGLQIARGYFANSAKTEQAFVTIAGDRLYKTGDNVRMLGNGTFEFIGRTDDQVKIRGQRVELGEINELIQQSSETVKSASSQILKGSAMSKEQLVAFVAVGSELSQEDQRSCRQIISAYLSSRLPPYMIPKMVVFLERIPLSKAGKVNKRALQKYMEQNAASSDDRSDGHGATQISEVEQIVRHVFAEISEVDVSQLAIDTTMFQLGLDSISAIQMASAIKKKGFGINASMVLSNPSVRKLTRVLGADGQSLPAAETGSNFDFSAFDQLHRKTIVESYNISSSSIKSIRPTTALQSGMLAVSIHSAGRLYFNHMTYTIPHDLDLSLLASAWGTVTLKYEILRSGFVHVNDSAHPVAMVTYDNAKSRIPVEKVSTSEFDLGSWKTEMVRNALEDMCLPPWKILLTRGAMHFSAHHAVYDAHVLDLILRDLELAYNRTALSDAPTIEPQLAKCLCAGSGNDDSDKFWKSIGEKTFVTRLPVLTPLKIEEQSTREISLKCTFGRQELEQKCRNHGITMQVAGQAAWGRLISAYTGEHEITFGTVLSGRTTVDSEEVGLPSITTVPTPIHAGKPKQEYLEDLMSFNASVQQHQYVPLKRIEQITGHSSEALFDTIFTYQKRPAATRAQSMFTFAQNELAIDYPLSLEVEPAGDDELELRIYHRLDRVPVEHAQLMIEQFNELLCETLSDSLEWMPPKIEHANPRLYSITPPKFPFLKHEAKVLHNFVDIITKQSPHKPALEFVYDIPDAGAIERKSWTYEELDWESNKIANLLSAKGVLQGSVVGICFEKCPEAAFTMLGISKLGCSFLAIDSGAPIERKKFIMSDSKAAALITKGTVIDGTETQTEVPVINLDEVDVHSFSRQFPKLDREIEPQELSYCLYTSGTTGTPKGCAITHENVVQAFLSFHKLYRWNDHSRWLQFASYHFDVSVMEHFWSWSVGMTVVVASRDLVFADLAGTIKKLEITHTDLTPSLARLLDPEDVPSLAGGVFVTGGEMLRQEVIDKFGPSGAIHNAYGPTEATIGCTMYPGVPKDGRPSNIGWHFPVAGSFIVDSSDPTKPVLRGAVGEFVVSGKLVAQGYIGRPDLTKEKFITLNGERCYRTGDLVRILHNNSFDFVGRADDQVKLRGQRLEIGEINSVIKKRTDEVLDVTTQVLKHPKQQKEQLVSFIVLSKSSSKNSSDSHILDQDPPRDLLADLKRACRDTLPQYMIPTHIIPVNKLPLSANNKADAKQLKALYEKTSIEILQDLSHVEPTEVVNQSWSNEGSKIVAVLSKFLNIAAEQVSGDSSFFELGLDSISIISFARQLRASGLANVSPAVILKYSTPGKLANALAGDSHVDSADNDGSVYAAKQRVLACQHRYHAVAASALAVAQDAIEVVAPCTPLQQGIISRALKSSNGIYYGAFHFNLKADINFSRLRTAFQNVVDHVQILRTKFVPTDDGHVQVILREDTLPWSETDVPAAELNSHLESLFDGWRKHDTEIIKRPVEIAVSKTDDAFVLTLHIFHACYDGNSLPLLVHALLGEYYGAESVEYGPQFNELLPYGPLREAKDAQPFWTNHLKASSVLTGLPFPALASDCSTEPISVIRAVPAMVGLEDCRRKLNVTHQALFQACWGAVLQEAIERPLTQGVVVSGRSIDVENAELAIGPLFNTVPFLLSLKKDDTWQDAVRRCHDFNTSALPFQHTALRDIQKWNAHSTANGGASMFDTLFVFQKEPKGPRYPPIWEFRSDHFDADYALALEIEQTTDGAYTFTLVTQAGISNHERSNALLQKLQAVLEQLVGDVLVPISDSVTVHEFTVNESESSAGHHAMVNGNGSTNGHGDSHIPKEDTFEWNDRRRAIRREIAKLAGIDPDALSPHTSILELGLDSVDAVKLSSRLSRSKGIKITVSSIMRLLTVGKIASLEAGQQEKRSSQEPDGEEYDRMKGELALYAQNSGLLTGDVEAILPATPLQEGIVVDMIGSGLQKYFNHDVLKLSSDTDIACLKRAWQEVVDCTPILRTRFVQINDPQIDSTVVQVVCQPRPLVWAEHTIESHDSFSAVLDEIRQEMIETIDNIPPFRLTMLRRTESNHFDYLVLSLSHAMYDGWSLGLLHHDIQRSYSRTFEARGSFELALRSIITSNGQSSRSYWQQALRDTPRSIMPRRQQADINSQKTHRFELQHTRPASAIQTFCKAHQTTVAALSQTVWSFVLASRLEQLDVAFSMVLSGRDDERRNDVAFPTMNTIIARSVIHGTRIEMVYYTQSNLSSVSDHQHFPLRKALAIARGQNSGELVNSLFIYQKRPERLDSASAPLYQSVSGVSDEGIPIAVEAEIEAESFTWRIAAKDDYFDDVEAYAILKDLVAIMNELLDRPDSNAASFEPGKVSVCGLSPFTLVSETNITDANSPVAEHQDDIEDLSPIEKQIQAVIAMVARLDQSDVRKNSSLLSLGLDSISAIKVSALLRKDGLGITVNELLKAETVANIAKHVHSLVGMNGECGGKDAHSIQQQRERLEQLIDPLLPGALKEAGIPREAIEYAIPASPGQCLMLSKWQNQDLYLPTLHFHVEGVESAEAVCEAWKVLVEHTAILRTVFLVSKDERIPLLQLVTKVSSSTQTIPVPTSTSLDSAVSAYSQDGLRQNMLPSPTILFAQAGNSRHAKVQLKLPHALYDGYSIKMILDRFQSLLGGQQPQFDSSFQNFGSFLARIHTAGKSRRQFWTSYLAGLKQKSLPSLAETSAHQHHVVRSDAVARVQALHASVRKENLTIQSVFLAAYFQWYASLADAGRDDDIIVGAYIANRNFEGAEDLDVPTLGFVPLRIKGANHRRTIDIARQLQDDFRQIAQDTRGSVSLMELHQWLGPDFSVDSWVNLILEDDSVGTTAGKGPTVVFAEERMDKDSKLPISRNEESRVHGLFLKGNPIAHLYQDSIDIDGTISANSVDIGVLGPDTITDKQRIDHIINDISGRLAAFVDSC